MARPASPSHHSTLRRSSHVPSECSRAHRDSLVNGTTQSLTHLHTERRRARMATWHGDTGGDRRQTREDQEGRQPSGEFQQKDMEIKRLRRQLTEQQLGAMKQIQALRSSVQHDGAAEGDVQFYESLSFLDEQTRDLVLTIVMEKVKLLQEGCAPESLMEHLRRFEERVQQAAKSQPSKSSIGSGGSDSDEADGCGRGFIARKAVPKRRNPVLQPQQEQCAEEGRRQHGQADRLTELLREAKENASASERDAEKLREQLASERAEVHRLLGQLQVRASISAEQPPIYPSRQSSSSQQRVTPDCESHEPAAINSRCRAPSEVEFAATQHRQAALAATLSEEYKLSLDLSDGQGLGMCLDDNLSVTAVLTGIGHRRSLHEQVVPGDQVVEINGVRNDVSTMADHLAKNQLLHMTFRKGSATRPDEHNAKSIAKATSSTATPMDMVAANTEKRQTVTETSIPMPSAPLEAQKNNAPRTQPELAVDISDHHENGEGSRTKRLSAAAVQTDARKPDRTCATSKIHTQTEMSGKDIAKLEIEIRRLRLMLEELKAKLSRLMKECRKAGMSDEFSRMVEKVGLDPLMRTQSVFDRLYADALERIVRLEKLRERYREKLLEKQAAFASVVADYQLADAFDLIDIKALLESSNICQQLPSPVAQPPSKRAKKTAKEGRNATSEGSVQTAATTSCCLQDCDAAKTPIAPQTLVAPAPPLPLPSAPPQDRRRGVHVAVPLTPEVHSNAAASVEAPQVAGAGVAAHRSLQSSADGMRCHSLPNLERRRLATDAGFCAIAKSRGWG